MADAIILARSLGHAHCTDFNVGGGLGVKYTPEDNPPAIQVWTTVVRRDGNAHCFLIQL